MLIYACFKTANLNMKLALVAILVGTYNLHVLDHS